jgi:hypothetical protein
MSRGLLLFAGCSIALLVGCSDPKGAERVLAANGYSRIETGGLDLFSSCAATDVSSTPFKAFGANGMPITGRVCHGWFEGSVVRVD